MLNLTLQSAFKNIMNRIFANRSMISEIQKIARKVLNGKDFINQTVVNSLGLKIFGIEITLFDLVLNVFKVLNCF